VLVVCVLLAGCSGVESPATATVTTGNEGDSTTPPSAVSPTGTSATRTGATNAETTSTGTESGFGEVTSAGESSRSALVTRVIDGDTIDVRYSNGTTDTVRLLGVDSPEVSGDVSPGEFEGIPDSEAGREHLREWARRASAFAREELEGERVQVVTDPLADRRGQYGRLLAYVVRSNDGNEGSRGTGSASDGGGVDSSFNAALLEEGYARVYASSFARRERYERIEARARERNVGLWGFDDREAAGGTTPTPGGGSELAIARVQADASGDDNERPNGEYVVFENRGTGTLDLSGWRVTDEAGHTYVMSDGVALTPGARLTLYSGRGTDWGSELYWGSTGAIWNNGGDTVTVRREGGAVATRWSYRGS
jgi:micrococcal nuclease